MNLLPEMDNPSITHDHMYGNKAVGMVSIVKVKSSTKTAAAGLKTRIGSGRLPKKDPQTPAICPKCGTNSHSHAGQLSTKKILHKCPNCDEYFCQNAKSKVGKKKGKIKGPGFYSVKFKGINEHVKGESSYQCLLCNKMFGTLSDRNGHMGTHVGVDTHMCTLCGFVSHEKSAVEAHMVTHKGGDSYKCPLCSNVFRTSSEMDQHLAATWHLGDTLSRCTQCSFISTVKREVMTVSIVQAEAERHAGTGEITQNINIHITYSSRINQPATMSGSNDQSHEGGSSPLRLSNAPKPPRSETEVKVVTKNQSDGGGSPLLHLSNAPKPPRSILKAITKNSSVINDGDTQVPENGSVSGDVKPSELSASFPWDPQCTNSCSEEPDHLLSKKLEHMCQECTPPLLFSQVSAFQAHLLTHTLGKDHIQGHAGTNTQPGRLETKIVETNNFSVIDDADTQVPENGSVSGDDCHSNGNGESPAGEPDNTEAHSILAACSEQPDTIFSNKSWYMCKECKPPLLFSKVSAFQAHLLTHTFGKDHVQGHAGGNNQPSNVCKLTRGRSKNSYELIKSPKPTVKEKELSKTVGKSHGAECYKCPSCSTEFAKEAWFKRHLATCGKKICVFCDSTFSSPGELDIHMQAHIVGKEYKCTICCEWFSDLPAHMTMHAGETQRSGVQRKYTETGTMQEDVTTHSTDKPDESSAREKGNTESEKPHKCPVCGKGFKKKGILSGHIKLHGIRPYVCPLCAKRFPEWNILKRHMRRHTEVKPYQWRHLAMCGKKICVFCDSTFSSPEELDTHMQTHIVGKEYKCTICCEWFSDLPAHMMMHAGETQRSGVQKYTETGTMQEDATTHSIDTPDESSAREKGNTESEKPHKCPVCGKGFKKKGILSGHMKLHGIRPYVCPLCAKRFPEWNILKRHMRSHTGEKPYQCSQCGKQYLSFPNLKHHIEMQHTGEEIPYQCDQCGKQFKSEVNFGRHVQRHSEEKAHVCSQCDKGFIQKCLLDKHIRDAHGEEKHTCSYCGRQLQTASSLKDHEMLHTGEAPFPCFECGKRFSRPCKLREHMLTHTGERPHMCPICSKTFRTGPSLKTHMIIHSANKPFECTECGKRFLRSIQLKVHMTTHSGEKPFSCAVCGRSYRLKHRLKTHSCRPKRRGRKKRKTEYDELMDAAAAVSSLSQPFIPVYVTGAPEPSSFISVEVISDV